jgi:hypothetical protein
MLLFIAGQSKKELVLGCLPEKAGGNDIPKRLTALFSRFQHALNTTSKMPATGLT